MEDWLMLESVAFFLSSNGYPVFKIQNIKLLACKNTNVLQVYPLVILLQLSQLVEVKTLIGCMAGSLFCITLVVLNGVLCQVMSASNLKNLNIMMEQTLIRCSIISLFLILCGFHSCPDFSVVSHSGKSVDLLGPGGGRVGHQPIRLVQEHGVWSVCRMDQYLSYSIWPVLSTDR